MARNLLIVSTLIGTAVLSGCSGVRVVHDYDPNTRFEQFSDWQWLPPTDASVNEAYSLDARRVRAAIENELTARGFPQVQADPDFYVTYHTKIEEELDVDVFYDSFGYVYGPWWSGYGPVWGAPRAVVTQTEKAVIVVDVVQPGSGTQKNELVWRGVATYIWDDGASPHERVGQVREAVGALLEEFPPAGTD